MTGAETLGMGLLLLALLAMFFATMAPGDVVTRRQWQRVMLGGGACCALATVLLTIP